MQLIQIDEARLRDDIERGAVGQLGFNTTVVTSDSGRAATNQNWQDGRCVWSFGYQNMSPDDYKSVTAFFRARRGMARGFLFKDWSDFDIPRQGIGQGTGSATEFPIFKTYNDGYGYTIDRRIYRPRSDKIRVWLNGVENFAYSYVSPGKITFPTPPANGHLVEIQVDEFYIPVRFTTDALQLNMLWVGNASIMGLSIMEVIED